MVVTPEYKMITARELNILVTITVEYEDPILKMTNLEGDSFNLNLDEMNKLNTIINTTLVVQFA